MANPRRSFLDSVVTAKTVLGAPEVADAWDRPSALAEMSVRGLVGHLCRAVFVTRQYLEAEEPDDEPIAPYEYFPTLVPDPDVRHPANVAVRERGQEVSTAGRDALLVRVEEERARLEKLLASEPGGRRVRVAGDVVMRLDDYLVTRIVELLVHTDDLCVSVDVPTPEFPEDAIQLAIEHLFGVARWRHGDLAVLRALTRRERDSAAALRVL